MCFIIAPFPKSSHDGQEFFYSVITSPLPTGSFPCVTCHQHLCVLHHAKHLAKLQNWRKVVFATRPVLFSFSSTIAIVDGHQPVQKIVLANGHHRIFFPLLHLFSVFSSASVSCFMFPVFCFLFSICFPRKVSLCITVFPHSPMQGHTTSSPQRSCDS